MRLLIEIPEEMYKTVQDGTYCGSLYEELKNGTPLDEKELKLKRWIEKDIEMLNEIIESGWLISDLEKCPAIDACEDAITALKQYPILDKVRAEIIDKYMTATGEVNTVAKGCLQIIDKYRGESKDAYSN